MIVRYLQDTDTLYIEFRPAAVAETRELDENTLLDLDSAGNLVAMTIEHARERADIPRSPTTCQVPPDCRQVL